MNSLLIHPLDYFFLQFSLHLTLFNTSGQFLQLVSSCYFLLSVIELFPLNMYTSVIWIINMETGVPLAHINVQTIISIFSQSSTKLANQASEPVIYDTVDCKSSHIFNETKQAYYFIFLYTSSCTSIPYRFICMYGSYFSMNY